MNTRTLWTLTVFALVACAIIMILNYYIPPPPPPVSIKLNNQNNNLDYLSQVLYGCERCPSSVDTPPVQVLNAMHQTGPIRDFHQQFRDENLGWRDMYLQKYMNLSGMADPANDPNFKDIPTQNFLNNLSNLNNVWLI